MNPEPEFDFLPEDERIEALRAPISRREVRNQIYGPLIVGLLFIAIVIIALVTAGFGTTSAWADVSLILMIIPIFILSLIILVAFLALTVGVVQLRSIIVAPLRQVYQYIVQFGSGVDRASDTMTKPWISLHAILAAVEAFFTGITKFFSSFKDEDYG